MCGIAGFYRRTDEKLTEEQITNLFLDLQVRGTDATGVAYYNTEKNVVQMLKAGCPARQFTQMDEFKEELPRIVNAKWAFFHVRQASHGSPLDNCNNHPIMTKTGVLIHNGVVFPKFDKLPADGEVDSEQIIRAVEKWGWEALNKFTGSMAIAYARFKNAGSIFLYRTSGRPIVYAYNKGMFLFCSTSDILRTALGIESAWEIEHDFLFKFDDRLRRMEKYTGCKPVMTSSIQTNICTQPVRTYAHPNHLTDIQIKFPELIGNKYASRGY